MAQYRRFKPIVMALVMLAVTLFIAMPALCENTGKTANKSPDYRELRLFRQVMRIVQSNYVKEVSDKELIQGAINGMLLSLDPHSSYLTEEMFKELQVETKGEFGGLGIEITLENGVLTIVSPIEDTPAFKSGLKPGDKIHQDQWRIDQEHYPSQSRQADAGPGRHQGDDHGHAGRDGENLRILRSPGPSYMCIP